MDKSIKRVHVYISGEVTGVGFRSWTLHNARKLGLIGWVKNTADSKVEAVFEGVKDRLCNMIKKCKKGPEVSFVESVDEQWQEAKGEFQTFEIRS
ncbi:hypothetical protein AUJ73_04225 [Candidatus Gottesmanbacteria bacterium CG1_02_37_22]|uniref:acylphosphatase n=1 Tax=Candidatus Gottesmanbacteria bacterium CG1_02_37_22 TaxID=1805209 RepID=A0A1J4TSQ6_9BACT|nr:MAG: hypothetical protein AUJ73_04225 [Candidatus Gottesmanbacteria bacterium CG1_02_37_22]